jgi:hypothetical protein
VPDPEVHSAETKTRAAIPLWLWPHVLSLEAPAVAVLWAIGLGRLHGAQWWPGVLPGLALAVWTVYLADRTLDTFGHDPERLDSRHQVYHRFRPLVLFLLLPVCGAGLAWLALGVVPAALLVQCLGIGLLIALYVALYVVGQRTGLYFLMIAVVCLTAVFLVQSMPVSRSFANTASWGVAAILALLLRNKTRERLTRAVPKEIAGGFLFALGCTAWVHFIGTGEGLIGSLLETVMLAALFACNLTGISARQCEIETTPGDSHAGAASHEGLLVGLFFVCGAGVIGSFGHQVSARIGELAWSALAGAVFLALLHALRKRFSLDAYRVWADLAVGLPALALLWARY